MEICGGRGGNIIVEVGEGKGEVVAREGWRDGDVRRVGRLEWGVAGEGGR